MSTAEWYYVSNALVGGRRVTNLAQIMEIMLSWRMGGFMSGGPEVLYCRYRKTCYGDQRNVMV